MLISSTMEQQQQPYKVLEFYSGIGGMRYSLSKAGVNAQIVQAFEINDVANHVYQLNFGHRPFQGNIQSLTVADLDKYQAHVWLLSPPCQPYTRQGLQKHSSDARAFSFLNILELIPQLSHAPLMLLVENVVGFETSDTRNKMIEVLNETGYVTQEFIFSPLQFKVPYSRPRYFCLAKRKPLCFKDANFNNKLIYTPSPLFGHDYNLLNSAPEHSPLNWDSTIASCESVQNFLEFEPLHIKEAEIDSNCLDNAKDSQSSTDFVETRGQEVGSDGCTLDQYLVPLSLIERWGNAMDIVYADSKRCCCFTKSYYRYVKGTGSLLATIQDCDFGEDICYSEGDFDTTWCWSRSQIQLVLGMLLPFRSKMKCWGAVSHQSVRVSNTRYVTNEKCRGNIDEDRISGLPDDIILTFLSSLELKEAAKTSIFSKRWKCLWAKRTHLDFDYFLAFPESHSDLHMGSFSITQKDKYINWVNQVLGLHCNECIDTLRVCFLFDSSDTHHFNKLVRFALFRKVKNVELYSPFVDVYTLGYDILNPSVGIGDSGITSLTSIHLDRVGVTGDFIEFLLSKCYNLERLYVGFSSLLVKLKVIGLSCKLKQLAICSCFKLEELEIDAVNLMYLEYVGENLKTNLVFKSMPMLVEVAFGGTCFISWDSIFPQISHLAAHICKLSLDMKFYSFPAGPLPTFCNLKHLHMVVECSQAVSDYIPLIEACPVLHELKLEIFWSIFSVEQESSLLEIMLQHTGSDFGVYLDRINLRQTEGKTHPNLKVLKIVAYSGCHWDVKIILYIVRFACNLETIICDPNHSTVRFSEGYTIERSRARAYKLGKIVPPKISVVII